MDALKKAVQDAIMAKQKEVDNFRHYREEAIQQLTHYDTNLHIANRELIQLQSDLNNLNNRGLGEIKEYGCNQNTFHEKGCAPGPGHNTGG